MDSEQGHSPRNSLLSLLAVGVIIALIIALGVGISAYVYRKRKCKCIFPLCMCLLLNSREEYFQVPFCPSILTTQNDPLCDHSISDSVWERSYYYYSVQVVIEEIFTGLKKTLEAMAQVMQCNF